jgi:LysM repeat protein
MGSNFLRLIGTIFGLIILFGTAFYYLRDVSDTSASLINNFYLQQVQTDRGFFVDSKKNPKLEAPDLYLIQKNSLMAASTPITVNPQVLGGSGTGIVSESRKEVVEYVVQPGDTLSSIASTFNISLNTVLWANDLTKSSKIQLGQKLIILPVSGLLHLVREGDTLSEIAKRYKADVGEIALLNELSENKEIFIGDLLIIPNGEMPSSPKYYVDIPLADSYFIFPVQGTVSQTLHWYNAVDIANKCGTPILAAAGGIVQKVAYQTWPAGSFIQILHPNGVVTFYGHLSKISVGPNEKVSQGQIIGYMGKTGLATGCHLHFDVRGAKNPLSKYQVGSVITWE